MIKLTFCLRRQAHLSRDEFQKYWREEHGPLVQERAAALGALRYVQAHTVDADGLHGALQARNGGSPEPFDGTAELWFSSIDDFVADNADGRAAAADLLADEKKFIDLPASPMWVSVEHVLVAQDH